MVGVDPFMALIALHISPLLSPLGLYKAQGSSDSYRVLRGLGSLTIVDRAFGVSFRSFFEGSGLKG